MSSSINIKLPGAAHQDHEYYIYDVRNDAVLPSSGKPTKSVDFVGYLSVGLLPTVYPLYLRQQLCVIAYIRTPVLHVSPFMTPHNDVPCYILILDFSAPLLDLPFVMSVTCKNGMHGLYQYVDDTDIVGRTVVHIACYPTGRSLHRIMMACPQWRYPLAYLWVFIRIAMCSSGTQNPHLLASQRAQRQQVIDQLWPISLTKTNVAALSLETVLSKTNKKPISEREILGLFFYDVRRTLGYIIDDSCAGLGFGDVLTDKILDALQMFLRPHAHLLPLAMAKEIMYHVIFCTMNTCGVQLTIADLEPAMFRHAPHPPWETTAFLGSSLYQVLLQRLVNSSSDPISLVDYPTPSQIFMELKETAIQAGSEELMYNNLMYHTKARATSFILPAQGTSLLCWTSSLGTSKVITYTYGTHQTVPTTHFLGIEQTEAALLAWLQAQGRDTLPESLIITASVVFGLVDAHDLMTLIDMCLKEVAMNTQLQQEEGSCMVFLFNAIANLCEELENRHHPFDRPKPATVDVAAYAGACPAHNLEYVDCFQPTQATRDKCNAWLLTSSHVQGVMQVDSDTICVLLSSPKTVELPDLPECLLRPDDLLSLPYLKKRRTQAEVHMFSEAMECLSEFKATSDGRSSEIITFNTYLPDNYLDDFVSASSLSFSSSDSVLL
ncbi:uncharacterized protein F5147DRAFT_652989 [Suillus discolor]|uniref:Uncharacterized protein n=1 Tax=Suillus discolor TaxID=1912936 RepID=A0A9P7F8C6_9AGAM|nr:uncharacterized protein F5147DRAFT_652989 [Suillus discolor]KAG2108275.1 hypothetical protein F5147DRAFT_652989 [Suillus discolor]